MSGEAPLRLTGRSSSHFTRVAAMFAHELEVPFALDVVHDLTSVDAAAYGGNPALRIPTLHVGDTPVFGTDNICRKLAEIRGRARDRRVVLSEHVTADLARSAQEMVWHAMAVQVQLVVGIAFARLPADNPFFTKADASLRGALDWLDTHLARALDALPAARDVSVLEVSLFCLVEHIAYRPTVGLSHLQRLRAFATAYAPRESAQRTRYRLDAAPSRLKETP